MRGCAVSTHDLDSLLDEARRIERISLKPSEIQEPEDPEMGFMIWGYYDPPLPRNSANQVDVEALMNMDQQPQPGGTTCRDCTATLQRILNGGPAL